LSRSAIASAATTKALSRAPRSGASSWDTRRAKPAYWTKKNWKRVPRVKTLPLSCRCTRSCLHYCWTIHQKLLPPPVYSGWLKLLREQRERIYMLLPTFCTTRLYYPPYSIHVIFFRASRMYWVMRKTRTERDYWFRARFSRRLHPSFIFIHTQIYLLYILYPNMYSRC